MDPREHRRHPRFEIRLQATIAAAEPGGRTAAVHTLNLSAGGAYVVMEVPLPFRSRVTLTWSTPEGVLTVPGVVVHVVDAAQQGRAPGVGLQFDRVPDAAQAHLNRFLATLETQPRSGMPPGFDGVMAQVRRLMDGVAGDDLLGALGLGSGATLEDVDLALCAVAQSFQAARSTLPASRLPRILEAAAMLPRLEILRNPQQLAHYQGRRRTAGSMAAVTVSPTEQQQQALAGHEAANSARECALQAQHLLDLGQFEDAEVQFARAVELDPHSVSYQVSMAWAAANHRGRPMVRRVRAALETLSLLAARHQHAEALYRIALVYRMAGEPLNAEAFLRRTLMMDRTHAGAARLLQAGVEPAPVVKDTTPPAASLLTRLHGWLR